MTLKHKIIASLLYKDYAIVKGKQFSADRVVGNHIQILNIFCAREIDEIVFLDISEGNAPNFELIKEVCNETSAPLTIGGGIKTLDHVEKILYLGADRVSLSSVLFENEKFLKEASKIFGNSCLVASIDIKRENQEYKLFNWKTKKIMDNNLLDFLFKCQKNGAGELMLNVIDDEGMMQGYDVNLINLLNNRIEIPIVFSCGAGKYEHLHDAIKCGANSVSCSSMYLFTEQTPLEAKKFLKEKELNVRI